MPASGSGATTAADAAATTPSLQELRLRVEVAKSNRRHNINSAPFRKVYADNRTAYFAALDDIIAGLRAGVNANPPTASDEQLQEAVSRSATDEALFPDLAVSDVTTDAPSVVDPIIPPQLALHTAEDGLAKDLFDTKAIGLATIPEFSRDNVQNFVDAVDQHQALRGWSDKNAATAATSRIIDGTGKLYVRSLIREDAPEMKSWQMLRRGLLSTFGSAVNISQRCRAIKDALATKERFVPEYQNLLVSDIVADIWHDAKVIKPDGSVNGKEAKALMSDTLFGASLTDEYLAVVEREAPKDWAMARRILTNYYRSVSHQDKVATAADNAVTASVKTDEESKTAAPVSTRKQSTKKTNNNNKAFEKKNNPDQALQCHHCGLMGHKRPDCHFILAAKASNSTPMAPGHQQQQQPSQAPFHRSASNNYPVQAPQRGQFRGRRPSRGYPRTRGSAPSTRGHFSSNQWTSLVDGEEWDQYQEGQVGPDQFVDPQFQAQYPGF